MKKRVTHLLRLTARILETTLVISLLILLVGFVYYWDSPVHYSNAFFFAGAILIVLGVFSVAGGFAQRSNFGITYVESAVQANLSEGGQRTSAGITQQYGVMIFLTITGLLLIGIAVLIGKSLITL
jgi:hypothetical protein